MIEENDERLLRDRILRYDYWFCYKEVDQYVELKGNDFVAEHVRVEYVYGYRTACAYIAAIVYSKRVY